MLCCGYYSTIAVRTQQNFYFVAFVLLFNLYISDRAGALDPAPLFVQGI